MGKQITITLNSYVVDTMIGESKNKSQRVEELIMKGYIAELKEKKGNAVSAIWTPYLKFRLKAYEFFGNHLNFLGTIRNRFLFFIKKGV